MLAIGIGCRKGTEACTIVAVIRVCLEEHGQPLPPRPILATGRIKAEEKGIRDAAAELGAKLLVLDDAALENVATRTLTRSEMSLAHTGLPSLCEAAALAAAGANARLLGPRHVSQGVTCAIALSEEIS
ncbi:cobalamin biosynthesis protein [Rhizobium helianthi]|uniref:Cobalamin biosynthesis protein n=1 Tax=Rhizobium helianthi TaxID=1132695 RepID=A0ABW4M5I7_9HYPH